MYVLDGRFTKSDFLAVPIILVAPPVALLIFASLLAGVSGASGRRTFGGDKVT
jgi:hypothetical protein